MGRWRKMDGIVVAGGGFVKSGRPGEEGERGTGSADAPEAADRRLLSRALAEAMNAADAGSTPARLCRLCVDLLDVTGASVSLTGGSAGAGALWWSSDPVAAQLAEAQYSLGDGPCHTARSLAAPVLAGDLTGGADVRRWPVFAQQAVQLGVRAVFSLPLGSDVLAIGSLDLYRRSPGPLSPRDSAFAFPVGDAITLALMRIESGAEDASAGDTDNLASWLDGAESDHEEVHYATGMVMVQLGVGPQHALARLRAYAFTEGRTVTEVARDVVARRLSFDE
jgi:hypothetical protein